MSGISTRLQIANSVVRWDLMLSIASSIVFWCVYLGSVRYYTRDIAE